MKASLFLLFVKKFSFEISPAQICNFDCIGELIRGNASCSRDWNNDSEDFHNFKEHFHLCTQNRMEYTAAADCEDGFGDGDQDEQIFFKCLIDLAVSKI